MTITAMPSIKDGCFTVRGKAVLSRVPPNVDVTPVTSQSVFVGAKSTLPSSRHVFTLGILDGYKFLALFRHMIWWMIPRVGESANEIPVETQFLLLEASHNSALYNGRSSDDEDSVSKFYILILPVLDGPFRATLQGNSMNELQFCFESGDTNVQTAEALEAVLVSSGDNPFELIKDSIKILEKQKGTFNHIDNKKKPEHLDWFGWCTWDAFYKEVDPQGIEEGLLSFREGGCSPRFLIIDDGWQDTVNEFHQDGKPFIQGTQFSERLVDIRENSKFRRPGPETSYNDLHGFIHTIKREYSLKFVYMWHALLGYWGGLLPTSNKLKKYKPRLVYPIQSYGNTANLRDIAMDSLEKYGIWIIDTERVDDFYDDLHSYLASCGVDGVKVDIQNVVETLGNGSGGRVALTRRFQGALEQSVARNFKDNSIISCMSHNSDSIYNSKRSAVVRASEDFLPREPSSQTLHVASAAFNSLLFGEIMVPDWDMFQSAHYTAEFHAAARAVGGCPVYVSDKPGDHDFEILKKLVLPDGSVLRARYAGRPTRDCLFKDCVMDGKSLLKIWNLNKFGGIVGVFNCNGAGAWPMKQGGPEKPITSRTFPPITDNLRPLDIEFLEEVAGENWNGDCAVYALNSGSLVRLPKTGSLEVSLKTLSCETYTVSPIRVFNHDVNFAPIGLLDMYNSGGALEALNSASTDLQGCTIDVKVRGCGRFGAYSSIKPRHCRVDTKEQEFSFSDAESFLIVQLPKECDFRIIDVTY